MTATIRDKAESALGRLLADGYAVIENVLDPATTADLAARVDRLMADERAHPFDPGPDAPVPPPDMGNWYSRIWDLDDDERRRLAQRQILQQRAEFDTPWPVPDEDVCISFIHIPTRFD